MASSRTGFMAIKKEANRAEAVKPTNFMPYKGGGIEYKQEVIENNPIKGVRWNALQAKKGKVQTDGKYEFDLDTYFIGYALYGVLGNYSVTDLTGAYKHTFNTANSLPTFSIEEVKGNPEGVDREVCRAFGVMFDSLEMGASDGVASANANVVAHGVFLKADVTVDVTAGSGETITVRSSESEGILTGDLLEIVDDSNGTQEDITATTIAASVITADTANGYTATDNVKVQLRPQTPAFDCRDTVLTFSDFNFKFGADLPGAEAAAEENVENWTISLQNNLESRYGSLRKSPSVIAPKGAGGMFKYQKYFENVADRDRYLDQDRQACIGTGDMEIAIGSTSYTYKIEIRMNDLRYTNRTLNVGNDELLVTELEASLFYSCPDGKAIEINVWNDLADYNV